MEGGYLVTGVKNKTFEIVGTDISRLTFNGQPSNTQSATFKLTEQCTYLSSEGLSIEEFVTDDTHKMVWVIHIPKHLSRRPVLVHKKVCQRIEDSLVELTQEKMISLRESSKLTAYTKDGRYMIDIKELYGESLAASIIAARDYGIITTEYKRAWYAEHIEPNPREIGSGHYAFPETLGREKRVNSIIKSMEE